MRSMKRPPPSASPPWTELPPEVTANSLQRLGAVEILQSAQLVCATWFKVCQDPAMWRVIEIICDVYMLVDCRIMCRHAVDRSQGQLTDLRLDFAGGDELLEYIVNRSSHLRRLTLESFDRLSAAAVTEAVKKVPELEEFRLLSNLRRVPADIESIATSCPSLNSFALKLTLAIISHNEYAVAISKFMPRLQRLRLDDCEMDNMGLEAILDGSPHLQSLHLPGCSRVDFEGALGKRCRSQIKDILIPFFNPFSPLWDDDDDYDDDYDGFFDFDDYDRRLP